MSRRLWIEEGVMDSGESVARILTLPSDMGSAGAPLQVRAVAEPEPLLHYSDRKSVHSCPCLATITGEE